MIPQKLTCEYQANPLGIDAPRPKLSWVLQSDRRGEMQTAYRVLVASSPDKLGADEGDRWDSGAVESDRSVNVPYDGEPLAGGEKCWWKVRVTDADGRDGPWSEPATFEMGLLDERDWQGRWIAAKAGVSSPLLRRRFGLAARVERARLYVCGLGWHEVYLNGRKVSDRMMDPAPTLYEDVIRVASSPPKKDTRHGGGSLRPRVSYVTHDVTDLLAEGENAVGVWLGHGWYSGDEENVIGRKSYAARPELMLQLNVELADGTAVSIVTDATWRSAPSPITANEICQGETYDARLEQPGWDTAGFDDSAWAPAEVVEGPGGQLSAMAVEPIRIVQRYRPTRVHKTGRGTYIFDMGQYISGFTEIRASGPAGTVVALEHAGRVCYETDGLDTRNTGAWPGHLAGQTDRYTCRGDGPAVWHPRYTVHGFRYVEVAGWPGEPTADDITGCAINNDIAPAGTFECSHELLGRIHHNVWHTFRGSFQGIPQDAAERAERVAWLGDPGYVAEDYMLNFADARFWSKWLDDIADSQKPDGACPFIAPPSWESSYRDWPCWENSYSLFAWFVYLYNDDPQVLERHYDGLRKQVERFRSLAKDHILPEPLGDHMEPRSDSTSSFAPTRTPPELTATAYHSRCAWILSEAARLLGRDEDARTYSELAQEIKAAFNKRFFNAEAGHYGADSQTAGALALYLGLVPEGREQDVLNHLVKLIDYRGGHLSTGIIGTDALEQALGAHGRADVMYTIAAQRTFPGWGYGVTIGQTTIAEDFECSPRHSLSMKMLGSVEKFFYRDVAGLAPAGPGYRAIEVRPRVTDRLEWAKASIDTVRGHVAVEWRRTGDGLTMKVTIPPNATATVSIPTLGLEAAKVTEGGSAVWQDGAFVAGVAGITGGRQDENFVTLDVGSGSYEFTV